MAEQISFDVFLSHNSADKGVVEVLARRLEDEADLHPFLDKWHLVPGEPWQEALENALDNSRTCAVFIGPNGVSPWENEEMRSALNTRVYHSDFRVVPVLLPGSTKPKRGELPRFLARLTWVDFRRGLDDTETFNRFVAGIHGEAPGREDRDSAKVLLGTNPYRGLEVFDEEHAKFFYGREALTQDLVEALRATRFLAVLGPSGSGKSSLVRAGLLSKLRAGALPSSQLWHYLVLNPGERPLEELAAALARPPGKADLSRLLHKFEEADERELHLQVREALQDEPQESYFCLVIDQFEEVFTLCHDLAKREQFVDLLRYAATVIGGRTVVVLTMRADFLSRATTYSPLADVLSTYQFLVSPMAEENLREAIEEPARLLGVRCEDGLVDAIMQDMGHEPGALPLMEHALARLWEHVKQDGLMTLHAYRAIGRVQGALAQRADAIFDAFTLEEQDIARRILLRLTQPGEGTEDTRRRAFRDEFLTRPEDAGPVDKVIQDFTDARLLVTSGEGHVDVSHEALIRGWPRLRAWLDDNRTVLHVRRRLTEAAQLWRDVHQDTGALYRGALLEQAKAWRDKLEGDLSQLEQDFFNRSLEQEALEEQETRKRARVKKGFQLLVMVVLLLTLGAVHLYWQNVRQQQIAQSKALSIASRQETDHGRATLGMRLALDALPSSHNKFWPFVSRAEAALLYALLKQREEHVLRGHTDAVLSLAFSPNDSFVVTASRDQTARLWDFKSGRFVFALESHGGQVYSAEFSHNGDRLVTASSDQTVRIWNVKTREILHTLQGHGGDVYQASFSPDDKYVITASDTAARLFDTATGELYAAFQGHVKPVVSVDFSVDGERVVTASEDQTARLWDAKTRRWIATLTEDNCQVYQATFSRDGKRIVTSSQGPIACLWNGLNGEFMKALAGHSDRVNHATFSPDSEWVATASDDMTVRLWKSVNGEAVKLLKGHQGPVTDVDFSPNGRWLVTASNDKTARLWETATSKEIIFNAHQGVVRSARFSPDGRHVVTTSEDNTARVWNSVSNFIELRGHEDLVYKAIFTPAPDRRWLFTVSADKTARIWDIETGEEIAVLAGHTEGIWYAVVSKYGKYLVTASADGTARLWNARTGQLLQTFSGHRGLVQHTHFSPDGQQVVTAGHDGKVIIWGITSPQPITVLENRLSPVHFAEFSHDGRRIVITSEDSTARLWDADQQELIVHLNRHTGPVINGAFSPDDRWLATASLDSTLHLWDGRSGKHLQVFEGHTDDIWSVAFSPDSQQIVTTSADNSARIWDTTSGKPLSVLTGHGDAVYNASFSPDGQLILTASADDTARLWHVASGLHVFTFDGHDNDVMSAAFSPDGRHVATASFDGTARLWRLPVGKGEDWVKDARKMLRKLEEEGRQHGLKE